MKRFIALVFPLLLIGFFAANAQIDTDNWVFRKNYYLLYLLAQDKKATDILSKDTSLASLAKEKVKAIDETRNTCEDSACFIKAAKFSDAEITTITTRLKKLYKSDNALGAIARRLDESGQYNQLKHSSDLELLIKAWEQDAHAVNYCIDVYGGGRKPNYPKIDSISINESKRMYMGTLYTLAAVIGRENNATQLFFEPTTNYALILLEINERTQAGDFEPMEQGVNKAAADAVKNINWKNYPYSLILVPGAGPDVPTMPLSAAGMLRCRLAAKLYFEGKAPYIMPSGGRVHPYKTPYCEATEMKRYLMETLHVPQAAIICEPHARHTTTNIRNCVRIIYRMGIPADKPFLISTDKYQSAFITGMSQRCMNELGYVPYKIADRVTENEQVFYPVKEAWQIDADEPMDP